MSYNQEALLSLEKNCYLRVEVLNKNFTIVNTIEGNVISGNINIDADSDIRRTCSLTLHIDSADLYPTPGGQMFINRYLRVWVGVELLSSNQIDWTNMGIYTYTDLGYSYDEQNKTLSISGSDLMSELTGASNGNIDATDVKLETSKGLNISKVMVDTLKQLTNFKEYNIDEIGAEYKTRHSTYSGAEYTALPYDLSVDSSPTVYSILSELASIYPNWEFYFDVNGVFNCHMIPDGQYEPNILTDDILSQIAISDQMQTNPTEVFNCISVYGALLEPDKAAEKKEISLDRGTQYDKLTLTIKDDDNKDEKMSTYINDQETLSLEIPQFGNKENKAVHLVDGNVYAIQNGYWTDAVKVDGGKCFVKKNISASEQIIYEDAYTDIGEEDKKHYIRVPNPNKDEDPETDDDTLSFEDYHYRESNNTQDPNKSLVLLPGGIAIAVKCVNFLEQGKSAAAGDYAMRDAYGHDISIKKSYIIDGISWGYGANIILKNDPPKIICGEQVYNYSGTVLEENKDVSIAVIDGKIVQYGDTRQTPKELNDLNNEKKLIFDVKNLKYRLIAKSSYTVLPDDNDRYIYFLNSERIVEKLSLKQTVIHFSGDASDVLIPVFTDNEIIDYSYDVTVPISTFKVPNLQPEEIYVFKYVDISNYLDLTPEQMVYYIQLMTLTFSSSFTSDDRTALQKLINAMKQEPFLSQASYNNVMKIISGKKFCTQGYFLLLGRTQIRAVYEETSPDNPFNINAVGKILKVYTGEESETIISDSLAMQRAKWEAYKATRFQYYLTLDTLMIPWLDVNRKISYTPQSTGETKEFIIKSISHDLSNWTTSITAPEYYPYYDETVDRNAAEYEQDVTIDFTFDESQCKALSETSHKINKYDDTKIVLEVCPLPTYSVEGWKDTYTEKIVSKGNRIVVGNSIDGAIRNQNYEVITKSGGDKSLVTFTSSNEDLGTCSVQTSLCSIQDTENSLLFTPATVTAQPTDKGAFVHWVKLYNQEPVSDNPTLRITDILDSPFMLTDWSYEAVFEYKNKYRIVTFEKTRDETLSSPTNDIGKISTESIETGIKDGGIDVTPSDNILCKAYSDTQAKFVKWIDENGKTVSTNPVLYADMYVTGKYPSGVETNSIPDHFIAVFDEILKDIRISYRVRTPSYADCYTDPLYEIVYDTYGNFHQPKGATAVATAGAELYQFDHWENEDGETVTNSETEGEPSETKPQKNHFDVYKYYNDNRRNIRKSAVFTAVFSVYQKPE